jgi:hypothetical protein
MASEDQCYEGVGLQRSMAEIAALFFWRSADAHRFVFVPPPARLGMEDRDRMSIAPGMQWIRLGFISAIHCSIVHNG